MCYTYFLALAAKMSSQLVVFNRLVVVLSLHVTHVETAWKSSSLAPCEMDGSGYFVLAGLSLDSDSCLSARSPGRCLWPSCC